jgi:hypothetical protein
MRFLPLALLLACPPVEEGDKPGDESDADTDADSDADSDADADADADGPCPAYSGFGAVGTTWEYEYTGGAAGTYTSTVATIEGGAIELVGEGETTSGGYTTTFTSSTWFECDAEGAWLVSSHSDNVTDVGDSTVESWSDATYDPPALLIPSGLAVGVQWETAYVGESTTNTGGPYAFDFTYSYEVTEETSVTVPAGTYTTLHAVGSADSSSTEFWADRNVGTVKSSGTELVSYTE